MIMWYQNYRLTEWKEENWIKKWRSILLVMKPTSLTRVDPADKRSRQEIPIFSYPDSTAGHHDHHRMMQWSFFSSYHNSLRSFFFSPIFPRLLFSSSRFRTLFSSGVIRFYLQYIFYFCSHYSSTKAMVHPPMSLFNISGGKKMEKRWGERKGEMRGRVNLSCLNLNASVWINWGVRERRSIEHDEHWLLRRLQRIPGKRRQEERENDQSVVHRLFDYRTKKRIFPAIINFLGNRNQYPLL